MTLVIFRVRMILIMQNVKQRIEHESVGIQRLNNVLCMFHGCEGC